MIGAATVGERPIAVARWASVALIVLLAAVSAYGPSMTFWVEGVNLPALVGGVAALIVPALAVAGTIAVVARRRTGRTSRTAAPGGASSSWLRIALVLAQAGWAAFVAGLAFSLTDVAIGESAGWGVAVITFAEALALLSLAWWAEDRLASAAPRYTMTSRASGP